MFCAVLILTADHDDDTLGRMRVWASGTCAQAMLCWHPPESSCDWLCCMQAKKDGVKAEKAAKVERKKRKK